VAWKVEFTATAASRYRRLPPSLQARIAARIEQLQSSPFDPRIAKRLSGFEALYSSRLGDWRLVFRAEASLQVVTILKIGPRGQVYRGLEE
jgi:mRNA interferase RelE/StbE